MTGPVALFVEDPGAVNCIAPVAAALGPAARLYGHGAAIALLRDRQLAAAPIDPADPAAILDPEVRLLVVGTSENRRSPAFAMIAAARARQVPSVAIVDSPANADQRFRGVGADPLGHAPDLLMVADRATADAFAELGFPTAGLRIVGHPNDDRVAAIAADLARADRSALRAELFPAAGDRPIWVFVSEISAGLDPGGYARTADYTLTGRGARALRTEVVVEELLDGVAALDGVRPYLVLRRHPKEAATDLADLAGGFDQISVGGSPHRLIHAADAVLGMTTMLLAEARLMGRPALSILPRAGEAQWLSALAEGLIPTVTTRGALAAGLRDLRTRAAAPPPPAPAERVVDRIVAILDEVAP